ncbi:hypothetical protein A2567_00395 [Candidatus Azambacteria bacterium RIFOXYD1_FULL_42_11]|uniref:Pilus assembly protein, PilO n=4 Tax=Candidatus Azamiibacteriota TaxID=1752741 RepID=A0A0G0ZBV3_9BACT|nr:MAG: Pilus assembly protein, PilO [Candidatus Azambacteria bacterium GW2011_GWB1_42_17]KKS46200.1 MAG: Pilus assembly protein, PilO [Candidatus Azambacteria bacterium GW2011_GWA1_42_19]KKS75598.1 MAG: Pilus assembly protein, PilO [Candidatus Azambacteria bacterium GW2011_GWA2_42_9]KKS88794.1 MAG: Pilus assembly protein, PilO [Parcubacteria group bacterium GW2011_GWC1_43_11]OGD42080.1 MAG: hypothetical protein A2567_00395 [Candidatus Azambacteria bacterium RIFOXYD1_FULL_42_11]
MPNIFKYLILPLILFLTAIAVIFWVLMPLWGDIQMALDLKKQSRENLSERQKLTASIEKLIDQYNARSNDVAIFDAAIPKGQNAPELLINLEAMASETGLNFVSVDFKPKSFKAGGLNILEMNVKLKGSYPALFKYLKALEKSLRIFDVSRISFTGIAPGQGGANPNNLDFSLTIDTYFK